MLSAIATDFAAIASQVHLPIDERLAAELAATVPDNVVLHPIATDGPLWPQWIAAAKQCDRSLVIAPETDGVLAQSVAMLTSAGLTLHNGFGDFLRCASDKQETARVLFANGVPHPPTWTYESFPMAEVPAANQWVVKPRDGCGTQGVVIHDSLSEAIESAHRQNHLIQPWICGRPASISAIIEGNEVTLLPAVGQNISPSDITYRGGFGPLEAADQRRALTLAGLAISAFPRTPRGFIGLDLLLADDPSEDCVIEINPRLTTSYVGLRHIVEGNLAARILGLDRSPVRCTDKVSQVSWNGTGDIWFNG